MIAPDGGASIVLGVFVGGASTRMGGHPKGLLAAAGGESIVARWRRLAQQLAVPCVLVGNATAYGEVGLPAIADPIPDAGPLAGLVGLLRARTETHAIAVACDMPHVGAALLARLARAEGAAAVLAPKRGELFEPLFARYERARVLPLAERQLGAGDRSLQRLLRAAGAEAFELTDDEWPQLTDWDEPGDVET
jgi:molybdopterin-guanine dinucleotide biosynthesis protein A